MTGQRKYIRDAFEAIHTSTAALQKVGAIDHITSESRVQECESGSKQYSGMALKLLSVVQKHGLEILV